MVDRLTKAGDRLAGEGCPDIPTDGGVLRPVFFEYDPLSEVLPLKKVLKLLAQDEPLVDDPADDGCVPYDADISQSLGDFS